MDFDAGLVIGDNVLAAGDPHLDVRPSKRLTWSCAFNAAPDYLTSLIRFRPDQQCVSKSTSAAERWMSALVGAGQPKLVKHSLHKPGNLGFAEGLRDLIEGVFDVSKDVARFFKDVVVADLEAANQGQLREQLVSEPGFHDDQDVFPGPAGCWRYPD